MKMKLIIASTALLAAIIGLSNYAYAANEYGSGLYGACTYNNCGISLSSGATVSLPLTPTGTGVCTVASSAVTVTTDASTGYTLQVGSSTTANTLNRAGGGTVPSVTGTRAAPVSLTMNRWGYRVDSIGGFGAGPTTAVTNGAIPARTFAGVPVSSSTADTIATTTTPASAGANTNVWYGICANTTQPSGTYTLNVTYTAVVN